MSDRKSIAFGVACCLVTSFLIYVIWLSKPNPAPVTEMSVTRAPLEEPNWEVAIITDTPHGKERIAIMFTDGTNKILVPRGFNLELHGSFVANGVEWTTHNNRVIRVKP